MKECKLCKKNIFNPRKQQIYCSRSCSSKCHRRGRPPQTGRNLICPICQIEFHVPQWRFDKYNPKYCSRSCLAKDKLSEYGKIHSFKKTGKPKHKYKYIKVNGKHIREHRHVMQEFLGRKLESWEHVHHINDDSFDNRIENLVVLSNSEHQKIEIKFRKKIISS